MNKTELNIMELGLYTKYKVKIFYSFSLYLLTSEEWIQIHLKKVLKKFKCVYFSLPKYSINSKVDTGKNISEQYICFWTLYVLITGLKYFSN